VAEEQRTIAVDAQLERRDVPRSEVIEALLVRPVAAGITHGIEHGERVRVLQDTCSVVTTLGSCDVIELRRIQYDVRH
jgi:hypothetical protein